MFTELYRFSQRENKNNLEDWFTECLAAVLRSLNTAQWVQFLARCTDKPEAIISELLKNYSPTVKTQVHAGKNFGIPDLVIYLGRTPQILFENKVAHNVASSEDTAGNPRHQLHRYAEWLEIESDKTKPLKQLVFLTHLTQQPTDFSEKQSGDDPYKSVSRKADTWGQLVRFLVEITKPEGPRSLSLALSQALYTMLEDEGMSNEFPDSTAIASLEVFLSQGGEIKNLLERMWDRISGVASSTKMSREKTEVDFERGRYSIHRYVNRIESLKTSYAFIMTGIWYPELADIWPAGSIEGHIARGPQIFLTFADDEDDVFASITGKPGADWYRPDSDFLSLRPLHSFDGNPDERAAKILDWLEAEGQELQAFLIANGING